MQATTPCYISLVIPYYNAERSVTEIYNSILHHLINVPFSFEVVIIDDCSDNAISKDEQHIIENTHQLIYERLTENKGQSFATGYGVIKSSGELIITLDDDLIYNTDLISSLINQFDKNSFDALYCIRTSNTQHSFLRKCIVAFMKWIIFLFTKKRLSSIRILNKKIKEQVKVCISNKFFSIDKVIYSNHNSIGFINIDVVSIGKTRYNFIKLVMVFKKYLNFKIG